MNGAFLLFPVLFPTVSGALLYLLPQKREKTRNLLVFLASLLNSAAIVLCVFAVEGTFTLLDFGRDTGLQLSLTFGADGAGKFFALLAAALWPPAVAYAFGSMEHDEKKPVFFLFYMLSYGMTCGVAFAENLLTMYVFFEMLTLTTIPLVLHGYTKEHRSAAVCYAVYSLGGAAFGFMGVMYVLFAAGSTDFSLGGIFTGTPDAVEQILFLICFFGFGVKAAVFPLCRWLPKASVAPTPVTALLHAVAVVKAGAFAILRLVYYIFGAERLSGSLSQQIALLFALITVVYGSAKALQSGHFKRRLAWSTVANLSYILAGLLLCTQEGLQAALMHTAAHALTKITAFFCAGAFLHATGKERIEDLDGVGRKMPVTFACFTLAACSLLGLPPFFGFSSKWMLITAGAQTGGVWGILTVFTLLISALLTAIYMFSTVMRAFFPKENKDLYAQSRVKEAGALMLVPTVILAAGTLFGGIFSPALANAIASLF